MIRYLPLEVGSLVGFVVLLVIIMLAPPIFFFIIGFIMRSKQDNKGAKVFFILGGVYLLIGLGICGALTAF